MSAFIRDGFTRNLGAEGRLVEDYTFSGRSEENDNAGLFHYWWNEAVEHGDSGGPVMAWNNSANELQLVVILSG